MRVILASASPRRRELLEQIGLDFEVMASDTEEKTKHSAPEKLVEELSRQKAEAVLERLPGGEGVLVIGADTVVARKGMILGKPGNKKTAVKMLKKLSGKSHYVYTGVTVLYRPQEGETPTKVHRRTFHEVTKVTFYKLSGQEIRDYADTGEPLDKAGAYGIQGIFARYIRSINGDYNNVVGLPVGRLYREIKEWLKS